MKRQVLVFGGSRFLGKALLKFIEEERKDWEVYSLTYQQASSLAKENRSILVDRRDKVALQEKLRELKSLEFDFVFDLSSYFKEDLEPSLDLLAKRTKSWIFLSSAGVYAPKKTLPFQEHDSKVSQFPHLGKLECENLLRSYSDLHSVYLRPFYIYGVENSFDRESFFFRAISRKQKIYLPEGTSTTLLQLIEVSDLARLIVEIAEFKDPSKTKQRAFNLGDQIIYTIESILGTCADILEQAPPTIEYLSAKFLLEHNLSTRDVFPLRTSDYFGDLTELNSLGLETKIALRAGLEKFYLFYLKNKSLYPEFFLQPKLERALALGDGGRGSK